MPDAVYMRDLAVAGGHIYVLDVSDRVFDLDKSGRVLRVVPLPQGMTCLEVHRLVPAGDRQGEVVLWCSNYLQFPLEELPAAVDPQLWGKGGLAKSQGVLAARGKNSLAARALDFSERRGPGGRGAPAAG